MLFLSQKKLPGYGKDPFAKQNRDCDRKSQEKLFNFYLVYGSYLNNIVKLRVYQYHYQFSNT